MIINNLEKQCPKCKSYIHKKGFVSHFKNCDSSGILKKNQRNIHNDVFIQSLKDPNSNYYICNKCNDKIGKFNINRHLKVCKGIFKDLRNKKYNSIPNKKISIKINDNLFECKKCKKQFKKYAIGSHYFRKHTEKGKKLNPFKNCYIKSWNKGLTKETDNRILKGSISLKESYKSGKIIGSFKGKKHSEETKEKIRQKRIEYLKLKTGQTAWERRSSGKMSYLEQWFYDEIIIKENLLSKYDIVNEYSEYPYFIDFAFLNIKLAVELDGACHFTNGNKRKESDLKKNKLLKSKGWNIFRIAYFENQTEVKERFLKLLKENNFKFSQKIYDNKLIKHLEIKKEKVKIKLIEKKENSRIQKTLDLINKRKQLILESNIDFTKKGWSGKVNQLTGLGHAHVTNFLRTHLLELFQKSYKRKGTKIK